MIITFIRGTKRSLHMQPRIEYMCAPVIFFVFNPYGVYPVYVRKVPFLDVCYPCV